MRKHMILAEMYALRSILLEGRMDFLKTKYAPLVAQSAPLVSEFMRETGQPMSPDIGWKIIDEVSMFDPDKAKKYTQWLLDMLLKRSIKLEDLSNAKRVLEKFDKMKAALPVEQRDIRRFKTMADLANVVDPLESKTKNEVKREYADEMFAQADVLLDNPNYRIVIPKTHEASCFFGMNTRWCTTGETPHYFNIYSRQGPLYIILDKKNNERWQFHFETNSFMDEQDRSIDVGVFRREYPSIVAFFKTIGRFFSMADMFDAVGNTEEFRKQLASKVDEVTTTYGYIDDTNLVVGEYKDVKSFVEGKGDRTAKWVVSVIEGDEQLDYDGVTVDDSNMRDLLHSLDNGELMKIGEWMKSTYSSEIEEAGLEYDPTSVSDIIDLQNEVNDDDLGRAFRDAIETGLRYGAETEMVDALKEAVLAYPHILFQHGDVWTVEFAWDNPIKIAIPIDDLLEEMRVNPDPQDSEFLADIRDAEVKVDEPRYGFDGWNEAGANERFKELVGEMIKVSRS